MVSTLDSWHWRGWWEPLSSCTWIRKSPFRWPVVTTKKIASVHWLEQNSKQGSYWIQRFYPQLLWYNWPAKLQVTSEERRLYSQAYNSNSNAWHWRSTKGRWDAMKKLIGLSLWKLSADKWRKILGNVWKYKTIEFASTRILPKTCPTIS